MKKLNIMYLGFFISLFCASFSYAVELKTEYQNSYPKYYIAGIENQKEIIGLCIDIIRAVEKKLPDIIIVSKKKSFVPFKRIQSNLDEGEIDIFFGFAKNKKRMKKYIFIDTPLYEVSHIIAVRANDNVEIKSFADIRNLKGNNTILTNLGTATERFLKKQGGLKIDAGSKDVSANLIKLLHGRGRFVYFHNIGLIGTIKKDFKQSEIKILPTAFRKYYHYVAFSKKVPKGVIEKVRVAIKELSEAGELVKIQEKYTNF